MELHPYQEEGADFLLARSRAYLADEMGLGKTVMACTAAKRAHPWRVRVVAPASLLAQWQSEWERWGPDVDVGFLSASGLRVLHEEWKDMVANSPYGVRRTPGPSVVIVDEAHYAQNPDAKRTGAILRLAAAADGAWLLSGTPMPNHPGNLYSPVRALWPEVLHDLNIRSYAQWFDHFCSYTMVPVSPYRRVPRVYGARNLHQLQPHLDRFMLRRKLADVAIDLPPLRVNLQLLPTDADFADNLRKVGTDPDRLVQQMASSESVSRLRRLLGQYKAPLIGAALRDELQAGAHDRLVVMAYHHDVLDTIEQQLRWQDGPQARVYSLRGGDTSAHRQSIIDSFNAPGDIKILVAQQSVAGVGLNLQAANEIVLVEPPWTPDETMQLIKRIHRIGQNQPCRARVFAVAGSLDEAILNIQVRKLQMQRGLNLD